MTGETRIGAWLRGLLARAHANTAVVALAAKMARIVWAKPARGHAERSSVGWAAEGLLRHEQTYEAAAIKAA